MRSLDYLRYSWKNVRRQKLRSALTITAIVIGALSVICMITLVFSASNVFMEQLQATGALTAVTVTTSSDVSSEQSIRGDTGSSGSTDGRLLKDADVVAVGKIAHVTAVAPMFNLNPFKSFHLEGDSQEHTVSFLQAYTPNKASDKQISAGRNLLPTDGTGAVLIGSYYAEKLGYADHPDQLVGKKIIFTTTDYFTGEGADIQKPNMNNNQPDQPQNRSYQIPATIVGVSAANGDDRGIDITLDWAKRLAVNRRYEVSQDKMKAYQDAYQQWQMTRKGAMPTQPQPELVTQSELDQRGYSSIVAQVDNTANVEAVAAAVKKLGLYGVTAKAFLDSVMQIFRTLGYILGAIGAISLLVAAIGVINTMVMATMERTREIGVMRAVGATKGVVVRLFTLEASLLGFWGGMIGVILASGLSVLANKFGDKLLAQQHISLQHVVVIPWWLNLGVVGGTTLLGLLAGLYPALRAARLNTVDALRYE